MSTDRSPGALVTSGLGGRGFTGAVADAVATGRLGGLILFRDDVASLEDTRRLIAEARRVAPGPILISVDEEGGLVSQFDGLAGGGTWCPGAPSPRALSTGSTTDEVTDVFRALGVLLRAVDIDVTYAPSFDVNTTDDNPVIGSRSFGPTSDQVAAYGVAALRGLVAAGCVGCAKHFPGHGATDLDSHERLPRVVGEPPDLPAFAEAVRAGVPMIMSAHVSVPALDDSGLPATLSRPILVDLLRGRWGYPGAVVSDALEMKGFADQGTGALAALEAGVDLLLVGREPDRALAAADELIGAPSSARIGEALSRRDHVLALRGGDALSLADAIAAATPVLAAAHERALRVPRAPVRLRVIVPSGTPGAYVDTNGIAEALGAEILRMPVDADVTLLIDDDAEIGLVCFERGNVRSAEIDSWFARLDTGGDGAHRWAFAPADAHVLERAPDGWHRVALTGTHRSAWEALARAWGRA